MKRVLILLIFVMLLNGCDDGNLTLEKIDFESTTTQSCTTNNILYKLKEKEALLLEIPQTVFKNEPTTPGSPIVIDINNSSNRVVYRFYNNSIASDNICNTIPPATPVINDQWTAKSGKIEITTTTIKSTNTAENSTRITGYNHSIIFKNITFEKTNGTQVYETFPFGDYSNTTTYNTIPFAFNKIVSQCSTTKQVYQFKDFEALTLDDLDPSLIVNTETPLNTPRTAIISSTKNRVTYRLYSGILFPNYFCNATTPTTPVINEEWNAVTGNPGVSGIIEVTTVKNGTTAYKHTIVLKNVTMKKDNNDFRLGDNYVYGELLTY